MAEEIVFGVVEKIVTELGYLAVQEIESAWGVSKELKDLHNTVSTIKALLLHAEEMQVNNHAVKEWLRRIKDVAYEAEDVIDEFSIENTHRKLLLQENPIKKVCYFVSSLNPILFRFKMAHRIKEINQTLTRIAFHKSFQLQVRVPNSERVYTHSYVDESRIFGREVEKQKMVQLLLDFNGVDRITIIPIQGLGGIGKTTLAKLAYNDKRVDTHFKLKMWVCVSEKFDVDKVIESILESATKMECPKLKIDLLQNSLNASQIFLFEICFRSFYIYSGNTDANFGPLNICRTYKLPMFRIIPFPKQTDPASAPIAVASKRSKLRRSLLGIKPPD